MKDKLLKTLLILILIISIPTLQAKTYTKKQCKQYAYEQVIKKGWTLNDYNNLVKLWQKESGWNNCATNGIYTGIPQTSYKKYGNNKWDYKVQINVGLKYIKNRYKNPTSAWKHWKKKHWY